MSTIWRPRPLGSSGPGDLIVGVPAPESVTSTRICRGVRTIATWKLARSCRMQFVASSDTISSTASSVEAGLSASAPVANRRAAWTDCGIAGKVRIRLIQAHGHDHTSQERRGIAKLELVRDARPPHPQRDRRAVGEADGADIDGEPGHPVVQRGLHLRGERLDAAHVQLTGDRHGRVPIAVHDHMEADQQVRLVL
jgi:hypothetical protein